MRTHARTHARSQTHARVGAYMLKSFTRNLHSDSMSRWTTLGENTVCSIRDNSGDIFSGERNSTQNSDECANLCLANPYCAFATYWGSPFERCYLYSACLDPIVDSKYKGITWKRHRAQLLPGSV